MTRTLTPIGDRFGLIIEPSLLAALKIDENTPLEVTSDGQGLYIRPVPLDHRQASS